jgi:hypothetical protein
MIIQLLRELKVRHLMCESGDAIPASDSVWIEPTFRGLFDY